jgi:hypothetical protein
MLIGIKRCWNGNILLLISFKRDSNRTDRYIHPELVTPQGCWP